MSPRLTDCSPRPPPYFLPELDPTEYGWTETQEYLLCTLPKVAGSSRNRAHTPTLIQFRYAPRFGTGCFSGVRAANDPKRNTPLNRLS